MFRSVILGPFARVILNAKREGSSNVSYSVVIPHLLRDRHLVSE
ncbi:hypothetical protein [Fibrobacter succinogenes]|nr:hypothetical protein [Fibrobacter succinogenes]